MAASAQLSPGPPTFVSGPTTVADGVDKEVGVLVVLEGGAWWFIFFYGPILNEFYQKYETKR